MNAHTLLVALLALLAVTTAQQRVSYSSVPVPASGSTVVCTMTDVDTDNYFYVNHTVACVNPVVPCTTWDGAFTFRDADTGLVLAFSSSYFSMPYNVLRVYTAYLYRGYRPRVEVAFQNRNSVNPVAISGSCSWFNPTPYVPPSAGAVAGAVIGSLAGLCCCLVICVTPIVIVILVCVGCITLPASVAATAATIGIKNRREDVNIQVHTSAPVSPVTPYVIATN